MRFVAVILLVVPFLAQAIVPPGGKQPAQLSEENRLELIETSVQAINELPTSAFVYVHVGEADITSQVVNGVIYSVDLDVAETECPTRLLGLKCHKKQPEIILHCKVKIYEQRWIGNRQVNVEECNPK